MAQGVLLHSVLLLDIQVTVMTGNTYFPLSHIHTFLCNGDLAIVTHARTHDPGSTGLSLKMAWEFLLVQKPTVRLWQKSVVEIKSLLLYRNSSDSQFFSVPDTKC